MDRREFVRQILVTVAGAVSLAASRSAWATGAKPLPLIDANDPTAKALGYVADAKKAPNSKGNKCSSCSLYVKQEDRAGKAVGTCSIFPGKVVHADGFCNAWTKKA